MAVRVAALAALAAATCPSTFSHGMMNRPSPRNNMGNQKFKNLTGCAGNACYCEPPSFEPRLIPSELGGLTDLQRLGLSRTPLLSGTHGTDRPVGAHAGYQVGCMSGCKCSGWESAIVTTGYYAQPADFNCTTPKEPTVNEPRLRTWNVHNRSSAGDWTKYFPWRAPGSAIPLDPCGVASGFSHRKPLKHGSYGPAGFDVGQLGSKTMKPLEGVAPMTWKAGATTTVSFGQFVNHGGKSSSVLVQNSILFDDPHCSLISIGTGL